MKKLIYIMLFLTPTFLFSKDYYNFKSDSFNFTSEVPMEDVSEIIKYSENLNTELNKSLRLNTNDNFRDIIILSSYNSYENYLEELNIQKRQDYIFLEYSDRSGKLIIYIDDKLKSESLAHHLTLQYLSFYGNNSPYWLSLGLANYFENYTTNKILSTNNKWLETIERSNKKDKIYTDLINSDISNIKPYYAWILVDYLINSKNKEHNRLLWDTLSFIKYSELEDKQTIIVKNFNNYKFDEILLNYQNQIKSYNDLMDEGIKLYNMSSYSEAKALFSRCIEIETKNYSPEYYLALTLSKNLEYSLAYSHFSIALDKGAPKDITYYSIGVNFYLNNNFLEASKYLNKIEDPAYKIMAKKILDEIEKY